MSWGSSCTGRKVVRKIVVQIQRTHARLGKPLQEVENHRWCQVFDYPPPLTFSKEIWFYIVNINFSFLLITDNKYPRLSDCIAGLPEPGLSLHYTVTKNTPAVSKFNGDWKEDPIPFCILEELYTRYLHHYEEGVTHYAVKSSCCDL